MDYATADLDALGPPRNHRGMPSADEMAAIRTVVQRCLPFSSAERRGGSMQYPWPLARVHTSASESPHVVRAALARPPKNLFK